MLVKEGDRIKAWITPDKFHSTQVTGVVIKRMLLWSEHSDSHNVGVLVKLDNPINNDDEIFMYEHCITEIS